VRYALPNGRATAPERAEIYADSDGILFQESVPHPQISQKQINPQYRVAFNLLNVGLPKIKGFWIDTAV
jgi:hypothetical protein